MRFVEQLPKVLSGLSIFSDLLSDKDVKALKANPGRWALVREDMSRNDVSSARNYLVRAHGLDVAMRRTIPGGTQYDLYAGWQCRKAES